jgi:hypothetical protein
MSCFQLDPTEQIRSFWMYVLAIPVPSAAHPLEGEAMMDACRDFGIAWFDAYRLGDPLPA